MSDWRKSKKANELREFINSTLKPKNATLGGLECELIIDFVAKEIDKVKRKKK